MFRKLLIANRGEIACRIIRTARSMGITTTAVYSMADKQSLHVSDADEAFYLGPAPASESYLNIDAIISVAKTCHADAIHPGYGFLSENADFARACDAAGIVFIGPSVTALEIMGSKRLAKEHLINANIPLIPGYHGADQSDERLQTEANQMGYPLLIKAANGGGGKGMREVWDPEHFMEALAGARREALSSFADDSMLLEKLIAHPRHVEIQIMADQLGNVVHLFERDCSIQRRHQKVIEEAPASHLSDSLRQQLTATAIAVARSIEYRGAGTVECLVDEQSQLYFMEMNTRLQVEHPVTEMITGLDLVEWQIRIAANQTLPLKQSEISAHGHAIECRVYAEDPKHDFLPSMGTLRFLRLPTMQQVRIETAMEAQSVISRYYDPMIAKIIAWGPTREQAIQRLCSALQQTHIGGVITNTAFILNILKHPVFFANSFDTHFLTHYPCIPEPVDPLHIVPIAAALDYAALSKQDEPIDADAFAWQMHLSTQWFSRYQYQQQCFVVQISALSKQSCQIQIIDHASQPTCVSVSCTEDIVCYDDGQRIQRFFYERIHNTVTLYTEQGPFTIERLDRDPDQQTQLHNTALTAPMPGLVVAVLKQPGDHVELGEALMVLEAMKMEHTIRAPNAGIIETLFYDIGAQVPEGATLLALEAL